MKITTTDFDGLFVIEPDLYSDARGFLMENWQQSRYAAHGMSAVMVQDNLSWSDRGVLRGLHFQNPRAQTKLITVLAGEVLDVVVDVRCDSPSFAQWLSVELSSSNKWQLYIPGGFAHGFCVLSDSAVVAYKCSAEYRPDAELAIAWNDPRIGIRWPTNSPLLSAKDAAAPPLDAIPVDRLPRLKPSVEPPLDG